MSASRPSDHPTVSRSSTSCRPLVVSSIVPTRFEMVASAVRTTPESSRPRFGTWYQNSSVAPRDPSSPYPLSSTPLPPSLVARALARPRPRAKLLLTHDPSWHLAFLVFARFGNLGWLSHQQSRGRAAPGSSGASAGEARRAPRERDGALIEVSLVTGCSPGPPSPGGVSRRSRGVVSLETGNGWW